MASSPKVTPQKDKVPEKGGSETPPDRPLLDPDPVLCSLLRIENLNNFVGVQ